MRRVAVPPALVVVAALMWCLSCADDRGARFYYDCPDVERPPYPELGWVYIPPGTFTMGVAPEHLDRVDGPPERYEQHEVTLTRGFYVQQVETPIVLFHELMGYAPGEDLVLDNPNFSVQAIFYGEALEFANAMSRRDGLPECYDTSLCWARVPGRVSDCPFDMEVDLDCPGYRLPTEAEWEYVARAGTTTWAYWGDEYVGAWRYEYLAISGRDVSLLEPNLCASPWGVFDMLGWGKEWVWDASTNDYYGVSPAVDPTGVGDDPERVLDASRVLRGGSWADQQHLGSPGGRWMYGRAEVESPEATVRLVRTAIEPVSMTEPTPVEPFWIVTDEAP